MKRSTIVLLIVGTAILSLVAGYAIATTGVILQQKYDYVQDLRTTCTTIENAIGHLDELRARQIAHGGSGWITTGDLAGSQHADITGAQINSAAADGPTLKAILDANGGAIRADLEAMR